LNTLTVEQTTVDSPLKKKKRSQPPARSLSNPLVNELSSLQTLPGNPSRRLEKVVAIIQNKQKRIV